MLRFQYIGGQVSQWYLLKYFIKRSVDILTQISITVAARHFSIQKSTNISLHGVIYNIKKYGKLSTASFKKWKSKTKQLLTLVITPNKIKKIKKIHYFVFFSLTME